MYQGIRWVLSRSRNIWVAVLMVLALAAASACGEEESDPAGRVFFKEPQHRAVRSSPLNVEMGAFDLVVEPAGEVREGSGHHHIIIRRGADRGSLQPAGDLPPLDQPIPSDAQHLHFDGGETQLFLELEPGRNFLTLMFAYGNHVPYDPKITKQITVDVTE